MNRECRKKIAFLYPGQGAQCAGMGVDFYENSMLAREVYDRAEKLLGMDVKGLCFEKNDLLDQTEYTQVAMVTTCLAMTKVLMEKGVKPDMTAGLSLGEYCAIAAAGGIREEDAIRTIRVRGQLMQNAHPQGEGAMAAVLGMEAAQIDEVLAGIDGATVANYNCPGQIVITGETKAVEQACEKLKEAGAKRCVPLNVSGAFHSPLLKKAGEELEKTLETVAWQELQIPYVTNVTAKEVNDIREAKALLAQQVSASVRWQQSMEYMLEQGVDTFVEIGPGKTLSGFMRKINRDAKMIVVNTWADMEKAVEELTC